jgi:hypothetical protein
MFLIKAIFIKYFCWLNSDATLHIVVATKIQSMAVWFLFANSKTCKRPSFMAGEEMKVYGHDGIKQNGRYVKRLKTTTRVVHGQPDSDTNQTPYILIGGWPLHQPANHPVEITYRYVGSFGAEPRLGGIILEVMTTLEFSITNPSIRILSSSGIKRTEKDHRRDMNLIK